LHRSGRRATLRAMKNILTFASLAITLAIGAGTAAAGGSPSTLGVGAETTLSGLNGMSLSYDAGTFHAGGFLSFSDEAGDNNTDIGVGGRFFWHVHSTPMSDLSIGGNLGILIDNEDDGGDGTSNTLMFLEPALQIRAFISGNVALSATAGIAIGLADAQGVDLGGQVTGAAGLHYYFF
jgi:hypothetical protein